MEWTKRAGYEVAPNPVRPGIYRLRSGGFLVRARGTTPDGRRSDTTRALHDATLPEAQAALDALSTRALESRPLFADFAVSRFENRVLSGEIASAKGRQKVESALRLHLIPAFGSYACQDIRPALIDHWRQGLARRVAAKDISAWTANTWISILRSITREMAEVLECSDPATGLRPFPAGTYTDERPNSLRPEQARDFLACVRRDYPQHYAMILLGFVTGKRPSTLRPLRRAEDVDWGAGYIRFRRSHTVGDEYMPATKTGRHERVYIPDAIVAALREHVGMLTDPPRSARWGKAPLWWREAMASSPLLFPGRDGGPRSPSCLDKPFAAISRELEVEVTPRAMRRTCNDLCRAAKVDAVVTRSITGHLTEDMRVHYSTAAAEEQRGAIAQVVRLVG